MLLLVSTVVLRPLIHIFLDNLSNFTISIILMNIVQELKNFNLFERWKIVPLCKFEKFNVKSHLMIYNV